MAQNSPDAKGGTVGTAASRYQALTSARNTALSRARDNSALTIPGLVPKDGQDSNSTFDQPFQSLGARGVNNLASWLLVTQFQPDTPFFRLDVHEDTAAELGSKLTKVREGLARIATKAQLMVESSMARPILMEVFRHLIVAGNALLYIPLDGTTPRMFRIDQYVCLRDEKGQMIEAIVKEQVYPAALEEAVRSACKVEFDPTKPNDKRVDVFTYILKNGDKLFQHQEINNILVPGSEGQTPYGQRGWLALRWQAIPGSDYGRAMVSEYYGDLQTAEELNKSIIQFAAIASRVIYIVDPNAMIDVEELNEADSGDYVTGYRDRIQTLQLEKSQDFTVANTVLERVESRLSQAFMLRSGMTRDAERVTAEEIRAVAQELENILGGTYTVLSAELQLPYVNRLLYILQRQNAVPELPQDVQPVISTGFAAMGRSHSANRLKQWATDVINTVGPQAFAQKVNVDDFLRRLGDSYGVEAMDQLLIPEDTQQAQQQADMTNQTAMNVAPELAKGAVQMMQEGPENG